MIKIRPLAALAVTLTLAACAEGVPGGPAATPPTADTCGAASFQYLVGQDVSPVLATTFTTPIRIIRPDEAVTMDFSAERLNFRVDGNEIVQSVTCG